MIWPRAVFDSQGTLARQHFRLDLSLQLTPLSPLFRHLNTTDFDSVDGLNHLHVYGAPRQAGVHGGSTKKSGWGNKVLLILLMVN
jgi:hypothetical protein